MGSGCSSWRIRANGSPACPCTRRDGGIESHYGGLVTWRNLYCFLGTPLVREGAGDAVLELLVKEGGEHGGSFFGFDLLATDGPVGSAIARAQEQLGLRPIEFWGYERATLERRPEQDYLALSAKHRRNFDGSAGGLRIR